MALESVTAKADRMHQAAIFPPVPDWVREQEPSDLEEMEALVDELDPEYDEREYLEIVELEPIEETEPVPLHVMPNERQAYEQPPVTPCLTDDLQGAIDELMAEAEAQEDPRAEQKEQARLQALYVTDPTNPKQVSCAKLLTTIVGIANNGKDHPTKRMDRIHKVIHNWVTVNYGEGAKSLRIGEPKTPKAPLNKPKTNTRNRKRKGKNSK